MTTHDTDYTPADMVGLTDIEAALREERPTMAPEPQLSLELPGGYRDPATGEVLRSVEVRELNGADEEVISSAARSKNYADYIDKILLNNVESIGGKKVNREMVHSLSQGDRSYLLLALRQATFGDTLELEWVCPVAGCGETNETKINIPDIPVKRIDSLLVEVEVDTPKHKGQATLRLATGADSWNIHNMGIDDVATMNTYLMARCLVKWNGKSLAEMGTEGEAFAKRMPLSVRRQLLKALTEGQPGPDYGEVKASCSNCSVESPIGLDMASLLLG